MGKINLECKKVIPLWERSEPFPSDIISMSLLSGEAISLNTRPEPYLHYIKATNAAFSLRLGSWGLGAGKM